METFHEMYFDGDVDFKGDALEILEYRHDWASFRFTISLYWFFLTGMIPEMLMHTRSQGWSLYLHFSLIALRSSSSLFGVILSHFISFQPISILIRLVQPQSISSPTSTLTHRNYRRRTSS